MLIVGLGVFVAFVLLVAAVLSAMDSDTGGLSASQAPGMAEEGVAAEASAPADPILIISEAHAENVTADQRIGDLVDRFGKEVEADHGTRVALADAIDGELEALQSQADAFAAESGSIDSAFSSDVETIRRMYELNAARLAVLAESAHLAAQDSNPKAKDAAWRQPIKSAWKEGTQKSRYKTELEELMASYTPPSS